MTRLPDIQTMSAAERSELGRRIVEWSGGDRSDVEEALTLCSALPSSSSFLSMARRLSPSRRDQEILTILSRLSRMCEVSIPSSVKTATRRRGRPPRTERKDKVATTIASTSVNKPVSSQPRPNHFDQWIHLMPEELRSKIPTIKENFASMTMWRREVERLADDPNASKADIARAAKLCKNYEALNLNIFAQTDICWEELCGKVVADDTKKEVLVEERKIIREIAKVGPDASSEEATISEDENVQPVITADQAQKYIRDKFDPSSASDAQRKKAKEYAKLIFLENGKLSKKVLAKLESANIHIEDGK